MGPWLGPRSRLMATVKGTLGEDRRKILKSVGTVLTVVT